MTHEKPTMTVNQGGCFYCQDCSVVMYQTTHTVTCHSKSCKQWGIEYALPTVILTRIPKVRT